MDWKGKDKETRVSEFRFILLVRDLQRQRTFYERVFGWPVVEDFGSGVMYDTGAARFELIEQEEEVDVPQGASRVAIEVRDVWTLFRRLRADVDIVFPLRDNAWGDTSFRIRDPEGFSLTLFTRTGSGTQSGN